MAGPAPDDKRPHDERGDATRSPVENVLERSLVDDSGLGRPLSRRAATTQRTVEAYLKTGVRPRWMERVVEIDQGIAAERRRLERAYRALRQECGGDRAMFARLWGDVDRSGRGSGARRRRRRELLEHPFGPEHGAAVGPPPDRHVVARPRVHR